MTGELEVNEGAAVSRAQDLLGQLLTDTEEEMSRPDPSKVARWALRGAFLAGDRGNAIMPCA
ncbi:hypothetical protein ACKWRH_37250 [Bradyrhizobium sp. Pa8]|uniref:hypothetical protein n=1 Tax=Bradyrhizobium sp. Pa8 TaxID=3386552 RepID=UPI00403F9510